MMSLPVLRYRRGNVASSLWFQKNVEYQYHSQAYACLITCIWQALYRLSVFALSGTEPRELMFLSGVDAMQPFNTKT